MKKQSNQISKKFALFSVCFVLFFVLSLNLTYSQEQSTAGVCPPFFLKDEAGAIINPATGSNTNVPYSPKQTCGAVNCHDYQKITKGYHFMQGAGEKPTPAQAERCQWASTPGNYGGTWCSPAPLYKYLSPKQNTSPRTMDMTSFSFITVGCGGCHPGGGSTEYDRNGNRYDEFMKQKHYTSGGDNNFDGDYYKARWSETGVLEADCMICHLPKYDNSERKKQLKQLNFRWAPTAAAGFATVTGSIQKKQSIKVEYNKSLFNVEGKIEPHIVREPRDRACLFCHAKPGWKKRGANFRSRTDVHIRAGLKCVDCHPAGSKAADDRINEKEMHQFGKGDDPGGMVRNDLDNTCRSCADCHDTGYLGAPIAKHSWLPPLHLENIACQTCHIPERTVKAAQFQAGDVFNPGIKIPTKGKHLWTFYGPDMKYWNHYGDLEMMGYDDKPTDPFKPVLARYKGKIYPVNRVHSAWPALEIEGKSGLMQPKMGDIYKMWTTHFKNPDTYPELAQIKDDNGDGVIEVNRPEEIDALITAVTAMLKETNLNGALLTLGAFRETYLKPVLYFLLILLCCVLIGWAYKRLTANRQDTLPALLTQQRMPFAISIVAFIGFLIMLAQPQLKQFALPTRFWLDANHFLISALIIIGAFAFAVQQNRKQFQWLFAFIVIAVAAGVSMLLKFPFIGFLTRLSYSVFDAAIILSLILVFVISIKALSQNIIKQ